MSSPRINGADALQLKWYLHISELVTTYGVRQVRIKGFEDPVLLDDVAKRIIEISEMTLEVRDRIMALQALDKIREYYQTYATIRRSSSRKEDPLCEMIQGKEIEQRFRGFMKKEAQAIVFFTWLLQKQATYYLISRKSLVEYVRTKERVWL